MLPGVEVKHKGNDGPLQAGAESLEHVKAAAGEFYPFIKINNTERFAQFPVGLGLKIKLGGGHPMFAPLHSRYRPYRGARMDPARWG